MSVGPARARPCQGMLRKSNRIIHWFTAETETAFNVNIHVVNTDPGNPKPPGRVYVDPMGEKVVGGLIKAAKVSHGEVNRKYG